MSAIGLVDEVLALATCAAILPPERRAIVLAEIDARLAADGVQGAELAIELQRLAESSS